MELKEFDIMLDIKKSKKIEYIEVVQKDYESNILNISIVEDFKPYDLTGLNVEIAFAKSDGTTVLQDENNGVVIVNAIEGKIICTLKTNTIAASGKVLAEVRILQGLKLLTTARFDFFVRRAIVNNETVESTNEFPLLQRLTDDVEGIIATEETRVTAENDRKTNETNRVQAEQARIQAETNRVNAETNRENSFNNAISDFDTNSTQKIDDFIAETERVETLYPERLTKVEDDLASHKEEYVQHQNSTMPHIFYDLKNNKKYRYGRRLSEDGIPQIISEEAIE